MPASIRTFLPCALLFACLTICVFPARSAQSVQMLKQLSAGDNFTVTDVIDLKGQTITLPEGCLIAFHDGGTITNGTVVFANTRISGSCSSMFEDVEISGTLTDPVRYAHWFTYSQPRHDDWNLLSTLLATSGTVMLDGRIYNLDKLVNAGKHLFMKSNTRLIGAENTVLDANHAKGGAYDALFDLVDCSNIEFRNIKIIGSPDVIVPAPTGHAGSYKSAAFYAFFLNNTCRNISFNNVVCENVGYGIKTSCFSNYKEEPLFQSISMCDCRIVADMPMQGKGYANFKAQNCHFESRGSNDGNHAIYILNNQNASLSAKNTAIRFVNCTFESKKGDGVCIQVYDANDTKVKPIKRYALFNNCKINTYNNGIVASLNSTIELKNCSLINETPTPYNSIGELIFKNCYIKNPTFYHATLSKCTVEGTNIIGGSAHNFGSVSMTGCQITASQYLIYNTTDECVPVIKKCNITINGTALVSQRLSQKEPIVFSSCAISINGRLGYCPGKSDSNYYLFKKCTIEYEDSSLMKRTDSNDFVSVQFKKCKMKAK